MESLAIGLVIGLIIGLAAGYVVVSQLEAQVKNRDAKISNLESQISNLQGELQIKTDQINELQTKVNERDTEIANLKTRIVNLEAQISVERGYRFFRENLWDEAKGAYRECPPGSGDFENNYWGDDNYLALIFHRDYERFKDSERANRIQQFLEENPPRLELGLRRWCVLSADNYTQYQPYNNWEYADQVALDGIYYVRIGNLEKAKECFNYLIEKMYRNGFIEDEATPENGHEYYKLALSLFLAHHLSLNEDPKANRYIPILTEKLLDLQRPNGSWLTDDKPPSWPNTETTILILIAFKT